MGGAAGTRLPKTNREETRMHTFFINTTQKRMDPYDVLFDVHRESRKLVVLQSGFGKPDGQQNGFASCVRTMGSLIDRYDNIDNSFIVIVYIDLSDIPEYVSIGRDMYRQQDRENLCEAMKEICVHLVRTTLLDPLRLLGRKPEEVLLLFGRDIGHTKEQNVRRDYVESQIGKNALMLLGIPGEAQLAEILKRISVTEDMPEEKKKSAYRAFREEALHAGPEAPMGFALNAYAEEIDLWCEELVLSQDVAGSNENLCRQIRGIYAREKGSVHITECPFDCIAEKTNKAVLTLNRLNLACYLLRCADEGSVFVDDDVSVQGDDLTEQEDVRERILRSFKTYEAKELAELLESRRVKYDHALAALERYAGNFRGSTVTPILYQPDVARFRLNEHGENAVILAEEDLPMEEEAEASAEEADTENKAIPIQKRIRRGFRSRVPKAVNLLAGDGYKCFDGTCRDAGEALGREKASPDAYAEAGRKVMMFHLRYLQMVKRHFSAILARYAGRSAENVWELLPQRRVCTVKPGEATGKNTLYRYATDSRREEKRPFETVDMVSAQSYETEVGNYVRFCAGRSLRLTDIEEQCDRFVTKIRETEAALKKTGMIAIGLSLLMLLFCLPYPTIQWRMIIEDAGTFAMAAAFFAAPFLVLYIVFVFILAGYRRKYRKAWEQFCRESGKANEENASAVEGFDVFLNSVIPSLRWIYEYRLDVEFYGECCKLAKARIAHHRQKLSERTAAIRDIIENLECGQVTLCRNDAEESDPLKGMDLDRPYCAGDKNPQFYTVIDSAFSTAKAKGGDLV